MHPPWPNLSKRPGWLIATLAAVVLVFILAGGLSPLWGALGFAVLGVAALAFGSAGSTATPPAGSPPPERVPWSELQAVIDALPDPVIALDRNARAVGFNAAARAAAPALAPRQAVSLALRSPALAEAVRRAIATGQTQRAEFFERVPVERWYEAHVLATSLSTSLAAGANGATLFLLTLRDLTPLRQVEEMRADFVANASHELRTPLAALSGFIHTLQGPARDDAAARERFLGIMQAQASRMARLIDDLLSLSRIELGAHIAPDSPVELVSVVRQVVDSLQTLARERNVEVAVALPAEPLMVRGDRDELTRVFENLLENALKYGTGGKRVDIALETLPAENSTARQAKVSVRDYGPGIAPEHLPRLTERFYRVDVGHSRAEGGTGLGLALVKHILNRHRGRLLIESKLGEGSIFAVQLPLLECLPLAK